jgi:hypothetical protein
LNPCHKNKRRIAWMALGVLDQIEVQTLRQHLETCPDCRSYWQSMSDLSERLLRASESPQAEPTEAFHGRVAFKIRELGNGAPFFNWASILQRLLQVRRLAAIAAALVLGSATLILFQIHLRDRNRVVPQKEITTVHLATPSAVPPPTLASYRRAAETSLETLDALLTQQAVRNAPVFETFTVSSLLAQSSEK